MNQRDVERAQAGGLPITCSTCAHYYAGNGLCGKQSCGGPTFGRAFPDYNGPIPRANFTERCLVCGGSQVMALLVMGDTRFGLCGNHQEFYARLAAFAPSDRLLPPPPMVLRLP